MNAKNRIARVSLTLLLMSGCWGVLADNPNASVQNKSGKTIWLFVSSFLYAPKQEVPVRVKVLNNEFYDTTVDNPLKVPIGITVFDEDNKKKLYNAMLPPTPKKTLYVIWDGTRLYPQSGSAGKTERGYPLDNNVTEREIEAH